MKLSGDEKRIQQLFRELSCDEGQRAPEFAIVLAAANSRTARSRNRALSLRLKVAVAAMFAIGLMATAIIVRNSKPQADATGEQAVVPALQRADRDSIPPSVPNVSEAGAIASRKVVGKRFRHRRGSDRTALAMKSLFAWRSPTASLLKTADDELMNSLPRLGESLQMIRTYSPEQLN